MLFNTSYRQFLRTKRLSSMPFRSMTTATAPAPEEAPVSTATTKKVKKAAAPSFSIPTQYDVNSVRVRMTLPQHGNTWFFLRKNVTV